MNPWAEWKAVCDSDEEISSLVRIFYPDIPYFADTDKMLRHASLDSVFICTPSTTHLPLAKKLSEKDVDIFVEKPLAESSASSTQMLNLVSGKSSVCSVGYYYPFKALFQQVKFLLAKGILNEVKRYRASFYSTLPFSGKGKPGNPDSPLFQEIIRSRISSFFFLIYWLFGPVAGIYGKASGGLFEPESGISLIMDHLPNLMGLLDLSWRRPGYPLPTVKISIEGSGGTLEVSDDRLRLYLFKKWGEFDRGWSTMHRADLPSRSRFFLCDEGYYEGNSSFLDSCLSRKKPAVGWEDGLEIARMMEAAEQAIHTNRRVVLNEVE